MSLSQRRAYFDWCNPLRDDIEESCHELTLSNDVERDDLEKSSCDRDDIEEMDSEGRYIGRAPAL